MKKKNNNNEENFYLAQLHECIAVFLLGFIQAPVIIMFFGDFLTRRIGQKQGERITVTS